MLSIMSRSKILLALSAVLLVLIAASAASAKPF